MPTTITSNFFESHSVAKTLTVVADSVISSLVSDNHVGVVYSCGNEQQ